MITFHSLKNLTTTFFYAINTPLKISMHLCMQTTKAIVVVIVGAYQSEHKIWDISILPSTLRGSTYLAMPDRIACK